MPSRLFAIAIYGNGTIAAIFLLITLILLFDWQPGATLFCLCVTVFCGFNVYVMRLTAKMTSEEGWLKSEIRKAELRKTLSTYSDPYNIVKVSSDEGGKASE